MAKLLFPMPVDALLRHPDSMSLSTHALGGLLRIALFYWETECRYVPSSDRELLAIARITSLKVWKIEKPLILSAFEAMRPELVAYLVRRRENRKQIFAMGRKGRAAQQRAIADGRLDQMGVRAFDSASEAHVVPKVAETSKARQVEERFKPKAAPKTGFTQRF